MPQSDIKKPPDKTRRAVIIATAGIVVILGLAVFYVAVVAPLRETHRVVRNSAWWLDHGPFFSMPAGPEPIIRLGGPERAARRLMTYLRLPRWTRTNRAAAIVLLGEIGLAAKNTVPVLADALSDPERDVRRCAALALYNMSPDVKEAVPALVAALGDSDATVLKYTAWSLGEIGPDAKEAISALEKLREGADPLVGKFAAEALKNIRSSEDSEE